MIKLSMPFWCVGNPVGDPFGGGIMDSLTSREICEILCRACSAGYINYTSAHDDDLVAWNPEQLEDDLEPASITSKTLRTLKVEMQAAQLNFKMITCNLHGDPVFRNGGLTNPDPRIRLLAARKVMRAIRIGNYLGAQFFTYWVARDGFESQFAVPWHLVFSYLKQGLNLAQRYALTLKGSIKNGTIEPKPNEPRGEMFLPTTGHALAFISELEEPDFWGVNPEVLQHEGMTNLSAVLALAMAATAGKLPFIHFGNQKPGQFDNDNPCLTGMDGLKETIGCLWALDKIGWKGHIEFDNHMLRTDAVPGSAKKTRSDFIRLNVENFRLAERKAEALKNDPELKRLLSLHWDKSPEMQVLLLKGEFDDIFRASVDYRAVNATPLHIGVLDQRVNSILLEG